MTDPMTTERLDEIEARANAATQGPWEWHPYMGSGATLAKPNHHFHEVNILKTTDDWPPVAADAEFIAAARTDVPQLVAALRAVLARHRPVSYAATANCGLVLYEVCPTCHDKAGVHPCGCWRDEDQIHICAECNKTWPCATAEAIETALEAP